MASRGFVSISRASCYLLIFDIVRVATSETATAAGLGYFQNARSVALLVVVDDVTM